jgi:endonuclease YncB( thermonuclease family)
MLLLSCGLFSSLMELNSQISTPTAVMAFPAPALSPAQTELFTPSFTPSESIQPPSETPVLSPTQSISPTTSPTLTPFPTILPLACLPPLVTLEYGQVKRVQDGTTILVDIQGQLRVVRYLGIQSPQNLPNIQYLGPPAATQNAALVDGQIVQLLPDGALHDQNGQLLRYVLLYNTQTFVNFELLRLGLAQTVPDASSLACYETFNLIQQQAQVAELGLWAPTPTPFPSATLRPTRTSTLIPTRAPTNPFSATPAPSNTATIFSSTPSSTPSTPTATMGTATPSPSGTPPTPTSSPTPSETQALPPGATITPSPTGSITPALTGIHITNIFYQGTAANESDEYIEIKNFGPSSVNLYNWWIAANAELAYFTFGQVTLGAGQVCRVYTNQATGINWCGSFENPSPIWDNTSDCADLSDANDEVMASYCYP